MSTGPSLYRRHRPRTFADVIGQEQVVRTLSHAVTRGQVHHAYLFVGSRRLPELRARPDDRAVRGV
jgi:DNA polymerase-3 subunit gamma/tau